MKTRWHRSVHPFVRAMRDVVRRYRVYRFNVLLRRQRQRKRVTRADVNVSDQYERRTAGAEPEKSRRRTTSECGPAEFPLRRWTRSVPRVTESKSDDGRKHRLRVGGVRPRSKSVSIAWLLSRRQGDGSVKRKAKRKDINKRQESGDNRMSRCPKRMEKGTKRGEKEPMLTHVHQMNPIDRQTVFFLLKLAPSVVHMF